MLLFELVTGHLPYPGQLKSGKLVKSAAELPEEEQREYFSSIMSPVSYCQVQLAALGSCCAIVH